MVKEWRGAGGQVWKGRILSLTKNSHRYSPAQTLYFLTHYTATKNSFTLLEIIIGQEKIHGWSAHSAFGRRWCPQRDNPIPCQKTQPLLGRPWKTERGGGGCEKPLLAKRRDSEILLAGICKKFWKFFFFEKSYGPFLTFLPTFLSLRSK